MTRLDGTVAVVTGASTGIGAATACALADAGATVALVARRPTELATIAARIASAGGAAHCVAADLTDPGAPEEVVREVIEQLGSIGVLVNNAGTALVGPIVGADRREWTRMVDLNVSSVMDLSWAALPHLLEAAQGERGVADLVTIASVAGRRPLAGAGVYAATKAAVQAFSESLRQEVTARQVRVGLVSPGAVRTDNALSAKARLGHDSAAAPVPYLDVDDIAGAVQFMVTRPRRMAVNELVVRPTLQVS